MSSSNMSRFCLSDAPELIIFIKNFLNISLNLFSQLRLYDEEDFYIYTGSLILEIID
jgi:hypothetical protein